MGAFVPVSRLAAAILAFCAAVVAQESRPDWRAAMETITAADLKTHLAFLASDEMRGRVTPSKELGLAAKYLAEQFGKAGAKPAAPGGGFFQVKKTRVAAFDASSARVTVTIGPEAAELAAWTQGDLAVRGGGPIEIATGPMMAVSAKELGDDGSPFMKKAGDSLPGIVLLVTLDGWKEKGDPLEHYLARAERAGAAGCVLVVEHWRPPAGLRELRRAKFEAQRVVRESARPPCLGVSIEDEVLAGRIRKCLAKATAESRANVQIGAKVPAVTLDADVSNVVAAVEPAGGPQASEAVIFTAHYDHIGMTSPVDGDWIYNGADDDGSGTVALLELAQAFASMKPAPARKVLFCAFFGEEKGGLGSKFYAENPAHPMNKTVCDVNIEMIGRSFDVGKKVAWVTGYDYSDLGKTLAEGGAKIGVKIIPDPYPRQNFFLRSDNVAFVKSKVPGHSISAGSTHPDYHGLNDEVDRIEFENMEAIVRAVFLGTAPIVDGSRTVRWTREIPRVR